MAPPPDQRVAFLHLSDRHFGCKDRFWSKVKKEFFDDLKVMAKQLGVQGPDFVVFSGDIGSTGIEPDYLKAKEFLEELCIEVGKSLESGLPIFAVPGNHDLVRPTEEKDALSFLHPNGPRESLIRNQMLENKSKGLEQVNKLFENYQKFARDVIHPTLRVHAQGLLAGDLLATLEINGLKIGLLGFNSAWRQYNGDEPFEGHVSVDLLQANALVPKWNLKESHHIVFVVQHHPPRWLQDEDEWSKTIERLGDHLLTGHVHEAKDLVFCENSARSIARTVAESLYGVEHWIEWQGERALETGSRCFGYSWGLIEPERNGEEAVSVTMWRRTLNSGEGENWIFTHPSSRVQYTENDGFPAVRGRKTPPALIDNRSKRPPRQQPAAATAAPPAGAAPANAWLEDYYKKFRERFGKIRVLGYDERIGIDLEREKLTIPLSLSVSKERKEFREKPDQAKGEGSESTGTRPGNISDALNELHKSNARGLVLNGLPGSGKTTLLHQLFLDQARGELAKTVSLTGFSKLIPVYVRWKNISNEHFVDGLAAFVRAELTAFEVAFSDEDLTGGTKTFRRPILLLGDGIDELRDSELRHQLLPWVVSELEGNCPATSRCVLSCRTYEYYDQQLRAARSKHENPTQSDWTNKLLVADLQLLTKDERDAFVKKWFAAFGPHRGLSDFQSGKTADALVESMDKLVDSHTDHSDGIRRLLGTPLLLSQLCQIHHAGRKLPERRGLLYEKCLGLLLEVWSEDRGAEKLPEPVALEILRHVAWLQQTKSLKAVPRKDLLALIARIIDGFPALALDADKVLELLTEHSGVLIEGEPDHFEFIHPTFCEWLAAYHAECEREEEILAKNLGVPPWREVIALALGRPAFAPHLLKYIVQNGLVANHVEQLRKGLRELVRFDPAPFLDCRREESAAIRELLRDSEHPKIHAFLETRVSPETGSARAASNPPSLTSARWTSQDDAERKEGKREHLESLGIDFVWVPAGNFWMGSSKNKKHPCYDAEAWDDEVEAHEVRIAQGFWIARTPTTNASYRRFVKESKLKEARPSGEDASPRFGGDLQPVVGVSHDDAMLFTQWLSSHVPKTLRADLPTEAEWERAARGTDYRRYPWGNEKPSDATLVIFDKTSGGQTAEVGGREAGASPCGALDMAGNVWEWCLDPWTENYPKVKATIEDPGSRFALGAASPGRAARVVRGGSWLSYARDLRCATRFRYVPENRDGYLGFRVVLRRSPEHEG